MKSLRQSYLLLRDPTVFDRIIAHTGKRIKRDVTNRKLLFLTFLSAYTNDPINYILKGPSSTGKTYPVIQVSKYFSDQDVWMLGGLSPKALIHEYGTFDKEKHAFVVSLEKKTLVFLDAPSLETLDLLKPILSHDKHEIEYRIVERTRKGKLQTKHAIIRGFPSAIFCTTESKILEEWATRFITFTPEMTQDKYRKALELLGEKSAYPIKFEIEDKEQELIRLSVASFRASEKDVIVPYADELQTMLPAFLPRDMRNAQIPFKLLKTLAFLHRYQRVTLKIKGADQFKEYVIAEPQDCMEAMRICNEIIETTRLGASVESLWFFENVIKPLDNQLGIKREDLLKRYYGLKRELIGRYILKRRFLNPLAYAGLIDYRENPEDKREKLVYVTEPQEKMWKSGYSLFPSYFTLERFKEWFSTLQEICAKNGLSISLYGISDDESKSRYVDLSFQELCAYYSKALEIALKSQKIEKQTPKQEPSQIRIFSPPFIFMDELGSPTLCDVCGSEDQGIYRMRDSENRTVIACAECRAEHEDREEIEARKQFSRI